MPPPAFRRLIQAIRCPSGDHFADELTSLVEFGVASKVLPVPSRAHFQISPPDRNASWLESGAQLGSLFDAFEAPTKSCSAPPSTPTVRAALCEETESKANFMPSAAHSMWP